MFSLTTTPHPALLFSGLPVRPLRLHGADPIVYLPPGVTTPVHPSSLAAHCTPLADALLPASAGSPSPVSDPPATSPHTSTPGAPAPSGASSASVAPPTVQALAAYLTDHPDHAPTVHALALGHPDPTILTYAGSPAALVAILGSLARAGLTYMRPAHLAPLITAALAATPTPPAPQAQPAKPATPPADLTNHLDDNPTVRDHKRLSAQELDDEIASYQERLAPDRPLAAQRRVKIAWPFRFMQIGERVVIEAHLATKAQRAVHAYAHYTHRLFVTRRLPDRTLVVIRLPDGLPTQPTPTQPPQT